jgi:hypothetical protein
MNTPRPTEPLAALPDEALTRALRDWAGQEARRPVRTTAALVRLKAGLARAEEARAREGRVAAAAMGLAALALLLGAALVPGLRPPEGASLPLLLPLCLLGCSGLAFGRMLRS